jgi:hypothetical protein
MNKMKLAVKVGGGFGFVFVLLLVVAVFSRQGLTTLADGMGIAEVNENVAQSTLVVTDITRDVTEISRQSIQVGEGSGQVQASAQGLSDLAAQLELLVKKFTV